MSIRPQTIQIDYPIAEDPALTQELLVSFGEYLRKQRMLRGVTHEEIVRTTKVRQAYVEALEREEFSSLPPRTFVLGFLRAIARYLGLDEEDLVNRYLLVSRLREAEAAASIPVSSGKKAGLARKKPLRLLAWFGGAMLFFFIITLPHFLRN